MKDQMKILAKANQSRLEKRYEDARQFYKSYLDDRIDDADVMWILAQVMYELAFRKTEQMSELLEEAIDWIKRAIALKSHRAEFYVTLGKILTTGIDVPDYEQAADCFRKALKLNPVLFSAGAGLALLVHVPESDVSCSEAVAVMERIAEAHPDNQHVFMLLGHLYENAKQFVDAQEMFRRAILCPEPLAIHYMESITMPRHVQISVDKEKLSSPDIS